jgi:hypothetical protein
VRVCLLRVWRSGPRHRSRAQSASQHCSSPELWASGGELQPRGADGGSGGGAAAAAGGAAWRWSTFGGGVASLAVASLTPAARRSVRQRGFLYNTVVQLVQRRALPGTLLSCVCMELLAQLAPRGAGDAARALGRGIVGDPAAATQLRVWLSYAAMEVTLGAVDEGARVLHKAVALSDSLPATAQRDRAWLWLALASLTLEQASAQLRLHSQVLVASELTHVLCGAAELASGFVPWARARRTVERGIEKLIAEGKPFDASDEAVARGIVPPTRVVKARSSLAQVRRCSSLCRAPQSLPCLL